MGLDLSWHSAKPTRSMFSCSPSNHRAVLPRCSLQPVRWATCTWPAAGILRCCICCSAASTVWLARCRAVQHTQCLLLQLYTCKFNGSHKSTGSLAFGAFMSPTRITWTRTATADYASHRAASWKQRLPSSAGSAAASWQRHCSLACRRSCVTCWPTSLRRSPRCPCLVSKALHPCTDCRTEWTNVVEDSRGWSETGEISSALLPLKNGFGFPLALLTAACCAFAAAAGSLQRLPGPATARGPCGSSAGASAAGGTAATTRRRPWRHCGCWSRCSGAGEDVHISPTACRHAMSRPACVFQSHAPCMFEGGMVTIMSTERQKRCWQ